MSAHANRALQGDFFGAPAPPPENPLLGLSVRLPDVCGKCNDTLAVIGAGAGPHKASLGCNSCGHFRGWISADPTISSQQSPTSLVPQQHRF